MPGSKILRIFINSFRFVPAIAEQWVKRTDFAVKLKGIGIGDGFTDPFAIISELPGFGYNLGLIDY